MYGRAMQCDECGKIKMIDMADDVYLVDGAAVGWIIIHLNQPLTDNFTYAGQSRSNVVASADLCTISCAQSFLRMAGKDITEIPKADS